MAEVGKELPAPLVDLLQGVVRAAQLRGARFDCVFQPAPGSFGGIAVLLQFDRHGVEMLGDPVELVVRPKGQPVVEVAGLQRLRAGQQAVERPLQTAVQVHRHQHGRGQRERRQRNGLQAQRLEAALGGGTGHRHRAPLALDGAVHQFAQVAPARHVEHLVELLPHGGELGASLQRRQAQQPLMHVGNVGVQQFNRIDQLRDLRGYRGAIAGRNLGPHGQVAVRQLVEPGRAGLHARQPAVARFAGGSRVHQLLRCPHPKPLLVGRQFQQLREDVARQAAVLRIDIDARRAPVDEGRLDANQRNQCGERQRKP